MTVKSLEIRSRNLASIAVFKVNVLLLQELHAPFKTTLIKLPSMSNSSTSPPSLAKAGLTSSSKTCCMSVIFCKLVNVFTSNSGILASEDKSSVM